MPDTTLQQYTVVLEHMHSKLGAAAHKGLHVSRAVDRVNCCSVKYHASCKMVYCDVDGVGVT